MKKKSPQDHTMDVEKIARSMGMTVDEFLGDEEEEKFPPGLPSSTHFSEFGIQNIANRIEINNAQNKLMKPILTKNRLQKDIHQYK